MLIADKTRGRERHTPTPLLPYSNQNFRGPGALMSHDLAGLFFEDIVQSWRYAHEYIYRDVHFDSLVSRETIAFESSSSFKESG
jgi:hypothetical protein